MIGDGRCGRRNRSIDVQRLFTVLGICLMMLMPMVSISGMIDGAGSGNTEYHDLYFDPNGGTGGPGTVNLCFDVSIEAYALHDTVPSDVPLREGYTFMGWSVEDDGTPDFQPSESVMWGIYWYMPVSDLIAYAIWESETTQTAIDVTFDPNGGTGGPGTVSLTVDDSGLIIDGTIPSDLPTFKGYSFLGWSVADDGTADFQPDATLTESDGIVLGPEHTVYAVWEYVGLGTADMPYGGSFTGSVVDGMYFYVGTDVLIKIGVGSPSANLEFTEGFGVSESRSISGMNFIFSLTGTFTKAGTVDVRVVEPNSGGADSSIIYVVNPPGSFSLLEYLSDPVLDSEITYVSA